MAKSVLGRLGFASVVTKAFLVLIVAGLTIGAGITLYLHRQLTVPGPLAAEVNVIIQRGTGTVHIAEVLVAEGIINNSSLFVLSARVLASARPLLAGEYTFPSGISVLGAIDLLQSGKTVVRSLTVPEGLTTSQVLALITGADGLRGTVPSAQEQGDLLPETYHYTWGDDAAEMVERMRSAMDETLTQLWLTREEALPYRTPYEALILASMIEKETSLSQERSHVAAVFVNRLRLGMRLQSDPTVVFALTRGRGPLGRALTRENLKIQDPYNTYIIDGLPPGPIANPGRASLVAALHPMNSEDLFFVADGNGGHVFAKTLREHQRNVTRWRALRNR